MLARTLVNLADTMVDDFDVVDLLTRLSDRCVEILGVDAAGVMLAAPNGRLLLMAASSETAQLLDLFELQADDGPCLDCYLSGAPVLNHDLASSTSRWPLFSTGALEAGFRAAHALPLRLRSSVLGAVNLLRRTTTEMNADDIEVAQALADVATIAILQHRATQDAERISDQLAHALNSRIVIEQAKGMVAERLSLEMPSAFEVLRRYARSNNLRLADIATDVISGAMSSAQLEATAAALQQRDVRRTD
jgi:GAF domain-containing protein